MAIVPKYESGQVALQPAPGPRLSPSATGKMFGGEQAQGIFSFAEGLGDFSNAALRSAVLNDAHSKKTRDTSVARDALNSARSEVRQFMAEVYQRKGKDAIDIYPEVEKKFQEIRKKYAAQFGNIDQQDLFTASYDTLMDSHLNRALAFQEDRRTEFEQATLSAENQNAVEDAIAAGADYSALLEAEETIVNNTNYANRGQKQAVKDEAVMLARHNLYQQKAISLANSSPTEALDFINQFEDKFKPSALSTLRAELEKQAMGEKAIAATKMIFAMNIDDEGKLAEVDKIEDAALATQVRSLLKQRMAERDAINQVKVQQLVEDEWDNMFKDPMNYEVPLYLPASDQKAIAQYKDQAIKDWKAQNGTGPAVETNYSKYYALMGMSDADFMEEDLMKYVKDFSPEDFKALVKMQREVRKGKANRVREMNQQAQGRISGMKDFQITVKGERNEEAAIRTDRYYEQFSKQLAMIPEEEQTEERVGQLITQLLMPAEIGSKLSPASWMQYRRAYRFEIPYLKDKGEQAEFYRRNPPESLRGFDNLQYDETTQRYYVDGDGIRDIYDADGTYIKSFQREIK